MDLKIFSKFIVLHMFDLIVLKDITISQYDHSLVLYVSGTIADDGWHVIFLTFKQ